MKSLIQFINCLGLNKMLNPLNWEYPAKVRKPEPLTFSCLASGRLCVMLLIQGVEAPSQKQDPELLLSLE